MSELDTALAAIRLEDDANRKNLRVAELVYREELLRVADSPDYRVGVELRAMLAETEAKGVRTG